MVKVFAQTWSKVLPQANSRLLRWNWRTFSSSSLNWIPDSCRKFFFTSWTFSVEPNKHIITVVKGIDWSVLLKDTERKQMQCLLPAPPSGVSWFCDLSFLHSDTTSKMALKWKSMRLSMAGSVICPPSWNRSQRSPSLCILNPICNRREKKGVTLQEHEEELLYSNNNNNNWVLQWGNLKTQAATGGAR